MSRKEDGFLRDCLGREIGVGSLVAWPSRQGSSTWIVVGRVTRVDVARPRIYVELLKGATGGPYHDCPVSNTAIIERVVLVDGEGIYDSADDRKDGGGER